MRILVVEDERGLNRVLTKHLKNNGYSVDSCENGREAIEYLDLAAEGDEVTQNESLGEVESKKAVSEMLSPLTGVIGSVNESAVDTPGLLNKDPYGEGWIVTIECDDYDSQVHNLMDAAAYAAYRA